MGIFEKIINRERSPLDNLHGDFKIKYGPWRANRYYDPFIDGQSTMKVRFGFDDPKQLDDCPFLAKVGMNQDPSINNRFIGFAYGRDMDRQNLEGWAKTFPYAEIILGLDDSGVITDTSQVIKLTE
jgi:hypothetical protein